MKKWFDKHFSMNRKELQGLSFLTAVIVFLWFLPVFYKALIPPKQPVDLTLREKEINAFLYKDRNSEVNSITQQELNTSPLKQSSEVEPEYFIFNPNNLKTNEGKRLGLSDYQIKMIQNYVAKGGRFYKKQDFAKIYSISVEDFQRLELYIDIPASSFRKQLARTEQTSADTQRYRPKQAESKLHIELNNTDSIELQLLKGIGPVFASRIIRFRDILGGFHDKSQLLHVYGMDEERYSQLQESIYVDTAMLTKINVNAVDYQQLLKHPYVSPKQANVIIQYRNQHGNYSKPADLLKIETLNEEFLRKIVPYLIFIDD